MGQRFYFKIVTWTAPFILLLFYLQLLTGIVNLKGTRGSKLTLGFLSSEVAYSFHTTYAPVLLMLLFIGHGIFGLQVWIQRRRWAKGKRWWEVAINVAGAILALQLLALYFI